jgi:hypothetical protein
MSATRNATQHGPSFLRCCRRTWRIWRSSFAAHESDSDRLPPGEGPDWEMPQERLAEVRLAAYRREELAGPVQAPPDSWE